jgi:formate/nitrite transporter
MAKNFLTPAETAQTFIGVGNYKVKMPVGKVIISSFLAGAYIALAAQVMTTVTHDMAGTFGVGFSSFIGGCVFGIALVLVLIAGSDLFTGNCLLSMGWLNGNLNSKQVLNNWLLVYFGNLIGSLFLVWMMFSSGIWDGNGSQIGAHAVAIAYKKTHLSFWEAFVRGMGCNWLVCLAVVIVAAGQDTMGKILGAWFPVMVFIASGFEHCVANMFIIPAGIIASLDPAIAKAVISQHPAWDLSSLNLQAFLSNNLLPVTLGNIVSGAGLVGGVYWYLYVKGTTQETPPAEPTTGFKAAKLGRKQ